MSKKHNGPDGTNHGKTEMRSAERFSLMMRAAKLLCESGEYLCIVRDVSATGTKLKFFHALPADQFMLLELGNGERFAVETVWSRDDHAGFRFLQPVDVAEFMAEPSEHPRRQIRVHLSKPALITAGDKDFRAGIVDLSQQGACVELGSQLDEMQSVRLEVTGLPLRFGHVRWRAGFTHGLYFAQPFRLDEFARHLFALQPYGESTPDLSAKRA